MQQITLQIIAIFGMIGLGVWMERRHWFPTEFSAHLSKLMINIFYPCLLFSAILQKYTLPNIAKDWVMPLAAAGIILVGWMLGVILIRYTPFFGRMRAPTRRAVHFSCTMNNYSFLPIMIVAGSSLGTTGVALVALTTLASDTFMWTLAFSTLTGQRVSLKALPKMCLRPPVFALLLAIGLLILVAPWTKDQPFFTAYPWTASLVKSLGNIGAATIPTSAFICGMSLGRMNLSGIFSRLQFKVTLLRMFIIPAITVTLLALCPGLNEAQLLILAIIALMPGAMGGVSIAEVYGGDTPFVSAMILNTHALCLLTVPLGLWVLSCFKTLPGF